MSFVQFLIIFKDFYKVYHQVMIACIEHWRYTSVFVDRGQKKEVFLEIKFLWVIIYKFSSKTKLFDKILKIYG